MPLYDFRGKEIDVGGTTTQGSNIADNMQINYYYENSTWYSITRIFKQKTDGTYQYPFVRITDTGYTPSELRQREAWDFIINSGMTGNAKALEIQNGVVIRDAQSIDLPNRLPLLINSNGDLSYYDNPNTTGKGAQIVASGIVSAIVGWFPIIVDYNNFAYPSGLYDATQRAQMQILGQYANGDYCVITSAARNYMHSTGFTMTEMQTKCKNMGLKFAYAFDGGGSVQTMYGQKRVTEIWTNDDNITPGVGRKRTNFIVFNGKSTYSVTPAINP